MDGAAALLAVWVHTSTWPLAFIIPIIPMCTHALGSGSTDPVSTPKEAPVFASGASSLHSLVHRQHFGYVSIGFCLAGH